jgi:hypothetical protein
MDCGFYLLSPVLTSSDWSYGKLGRVSWVIRLIELSYNVKLLGQFIEGGPGGNIGLFELLILLKCLIKFFSEAI